LLCPAPQQQFGFFFPADEGSQAARVQRLEAAFDGTCTQRGPGAHRSGDAFTPADAYRFIDEYRKLFHIPYNANLSVVFGLSH
jgi:hypothetical protein